MECSFVSEKRAILMHSMGGKCQHLQAVVRIGGQLAGAFWQCLQVTNLGRERFLRPMRSTGGLPGKRAWFVVHGARHQAWWLASRSSEHLSMA
jgi:hypothetical protein